MCDRRDMTKLEAYILTRPKYAEVRKQAYADWALDELLSQVIAEMEKPPYYISGEEEIPISDIIETFRDQMRAFRDIANPGKKLMFQIAIREAESLSMLFKGEDE